MSEKKLKEKKPQRERPLLPDKPYQCSFFLGVRKNRYCAFPTPFPEARFCRQHDPDALKVDQGKHKRVPCPLDPSHTVAERELKRHVRKCNAKKPEVMPSWFAEDVNTEAPPDGIVQGPLDGLGREGFAEFAKLIREAYASVFADKPILLEQLSHPALESRLEELTDTKHAIQQSSLIGHLKRLGLLSDDKTIVEFGCGRGEYSRYVHKALMCERESSHSAVSEESEGPKFLLLDRAAQRLIFDRQIPLDAPDNHPKPIVTRIRCDIKDLRLQQSVTTDIDTTQSPPSIVAISKHPCGAATDLSLRCLLDPSIAPNVDGIIFALCCHNVCSPNSYPLAYLPTPLTPSHFHYLSKTTSWAVSGVRENMSLDDGAEGHWTGLTLGERKELGWMAKRVMDEGRRRYVESRGEWEECRLVEYIGAGVTGESVALMVKRYKAI
ncbi:tRNA:m4X modification enzyme [Saitoella coloradoensis]